MNLVVLKGNVTRDVELRHLESGTCVGNFAIAINEKYKDKEYTTFVECEVWAKLAETMEEWVKKGRQILVQGNLKQDKWEVDGKQRSKMLVRVSNFEFCGAKATNGQAVAAGEQEAF